jgi:hypothetical protein
VSAVDKLLELTGNGPGAPDPDTELLRAAQRSARELAALVSLAGDGDDDGDEGGGGIIMNHGPFRGTHAHGHFKSDVHEHPHQHFDDNRHDGGPQHRPGSQPGGRAGW